jgi:hypothetical protein
MNPPPIPSQSSTSSPTASQPKRRGCLIASIVGLALFSIMVIVGSSMLEKSRASFYANKAHVLENIRQAGERGDENVIRSIEVEYGSSFDDSDYVAAMAEARNRIGEIKAEAKKARDIATAEAAAARAKAAAEAAEKKAADVPGNVAEIGKKILGDDYRDSMVTLDANNAWQIHINAFTDAAWAASMQLKIRELAQSCHPAGMKVSDFSVAYRSPFTDGLGNTTEGPLVKCRLNRDAADRINWDNISAIEFHKAFDTEFVHRSFEAKWE